MNKDGEIKILKDIIIHSNKEIEKLREMILKLNNELEYIRINIKWN
jgi:hypothetical protein